MALGVLHEDEPVELLGGRLVVTEPGGGPHATAIDLAAEALRRVFGEGWRVRVRLPLALGGDSVPEPDVAVVRGAARDYRGAHPSGAALVVEVAGASLRLDRTSRASVYACAGIGDYWIVNLAERALELHRGPVSHGGRGRYLVAQVARSGDSVSPLAAPDARVAVADLLP